MYKGTYTLIGQELSMFTRKLEAQLRYQGIPYVWQYKTMASASEIEARAGTRFIPLLDTPDGWLLNDTISIGPMLHDRFGHQPVIPPSPNQRSLRIFLTIGCRDMHCILAGVTQRQWPRRAKILA